MITDGEDGFLRRVGDVDGMSRAAIELLSNQEKLTAMKQAARDTALNKFAEEKIVPKYEDYYLRVASGTVREIVG